MKCGKRGMQQRFVKCGKCLNTALPCGGRKLQRLQSSISILWVREEIEGQSKSYTHTRTHTQNYRNTPYLPKDLGEAMLLNKLRVGSQWSPLVSWWSFYTPLSPPDRLGSVFVATMQYVNHVFSYLYVSESSRQMQHCWCKITAWLSVAAFTVS